MEEIVLKNVLLKNEITQEQLIDLAILMGTDYNEGIHGIGPKKGLKMIKKYENAEESLKKLDQKIDNLDKLRQLFLDVGKFSNENEKVVWKEPKKSKSIELLCEKYEFSRSRVEDALNKISGPNKGKAAQATLSDFS